MYAKIWQYHQLNFPEALVYAVMEDVNPNVLKYWTVGGRKRIFSSEKTSWVFFFDGNVKLMGF